MASFCFEGRQVYYETYGQGKPLLLLNGIMMSCASWKEFIEPLSAINTLILVDMMDQGKTDKPGKTIVCLPNRVELRIEGESEVDFVVK